MEKQKPKRETIPFDKFFDGIIKVHGGDCFVLIEIKNARVALRGVASSIGHLEFITPEPKPDYMG